MTPAPESGESLGTRLRRERERHRIELRSIAGTTKIAMSLLEDLERDDVSRWPSGIFRRSFVRAYAQAIGVDGEETVREFLERFPDPNDPERAIATPAVAEPPAAPSGSVPAARVRLTVAGTGMTFARGWILESARVRFAAIGCDAAVIAIVSAALYAVLGTLWMPLCITIGAYYAVGILLLGNTAGVCFVAPPARADRRAADEHAPNLPVDTAA